MTFCNRADLISFLMKNNIGDRFVKAIARLYTQTAYFQKINNCRLGNAIISKCGVTQGRKSSVTLFSYEIHDMPDSLTNTITPTFLLQLADDAAIVVLNDNDDNSDGLESLSTNFKNIFKYSKSKYLYVNFDKTFYIHISKNPVSVPLSVEGFQDIMPAKDNQAIYLGMLLIQSNSIVDHINANLKYRNYNVKKFHDWLDINLETPIAIKIKVLYNCMFAAMTYGCETWFSIDNVSEKLLKIERCLLKRILCVRDST